MFLEYIKLGLDHILDPNGTDHILFLIVLTLPFVIKEWKKVVILATAFTIGHSLTLILSGLDFIKIDSRFIEIAIAASILLTALYNIINALKEYFPQTRYIAALFFGLIHGLGFSSFFKSILGGESIITPLLCFNVGVEFAQLIVVLFILIFNYLVLDVLKLSKKYWVIGVSVLIALWAIKLIFER